ncbi:MAG TPA: DNA repair protein RecN [Chloroflexi bacterium]|nr:DNA repair protein RecN [Chloroflexota bacterium]
MLTELTIKDFAIIDQLTLRFAKGFNILTGETGAGKSIILDAIPLLLGSRADNSVVRSGAKLALIEGLFELEPGPLRERINAILEREGLEGDSPDLLVLAREIRRGGRSLCRINGRAATANLLREIGEGLVDIHGQSEHLSLLKPASHLNLLDRYGGLVEQRRAFSMLVEEIEKVRAELNRLLSDEEALRQRAEMLTYQAEEIEAASLKPGEDEALQDEARRLANAEQLAELAGEAYRALNVAEEGFSASDLLSEAATALARLARIDPTASDLASLAESLSIQAEELSRSLADYQETVEFDPERLQRVELRLDLINSLKRKYGCESIEALLESAQEARRELEAIEGSSERIEFLQAEEARLLTEIGQQGAALSRARLEAADRLSRATEAELADLRMEGARFAVSIEQVDDPSGALVGDYRVAFNRSGIDQVEFLIAPNPGEPLKPIARIASGGETSRIMLALKTVLSRADQTPILIFDEIDAGIGGRIGAAIGHKLWSLSANHQVLVVTHLPQLAGFGDAHFKVEKQVVGGRTVVRVQQLEGEARIEELSAMLGAEAESARQSAQEILHYVERIKQATPSAG